MKSRMIEIDDNVFLVAFSIVWRNRMPFAAAASILLATNAGHDFIDMPVAVAVLRALILMIVGYSAYRCLLSGGTIAGWQAVSAPNGRIPWRYAGVSLIILSPILFLGIVWTAPGTGIGPSGWGEMGLGVVLVVIYAALYILIGTALPEAAERGDVALGEAFERGRRNYRAIGRALVLRVWLFRAATVLVMITLNLSGVTTDFITPDSGEFDAAATGPMLLFNCSHVFAECLNAIVLARAYRRFPVLSAGTANS